MFDETCFVEIDLINIVGKQRIEIQNYLIILKRVVFICFSNFYLCLRSWLRSMFGIFLYKHIVICVVGVTLHNGNDITVKQSILLDSYFYGSISKLIAIILKTHYISTTGPVGHGNASNRCRSTFSRVTLEIIEY